MNTTVSQNLTRFEDLVREIDLVATIKFPPAHFVRSHQINFVPSFDDLDFLTFANLVLPSGNKIALVRHQNAPYPGTELRVVLIYLLPLLSFLKLLMFSLSLLKTSIGFILTSIYQPDILTYDYSYSDR